jgi:hypothetical protein
MSQNVAESSKVLERTSMLTIASVSPAFQVRMWTQYEWRDCFRKTDKAQFDIYHRKRSQYCPWRTGILQSLCTLGINMSDRTSQILTSRDCSFTFLTVYTRKKEMSLYNLQWQEIIHVCTVSLLKQDKLGCRGDTSPTHSPTAPPPPKSNWVNLLAGITSDSKMQKKGSPLHTYIHIFGHNNQC